MNKRAKSGNTCLADMYHPWSMCGPNMVSLGGNTCLADMYHPWSMCGPNMVRLGWICQVVSVIFQQYHGENKLIFNEMMMMSALY